jgi:hypothetical protein
MGNVAAVECQESEWPAAGSQRTNSLHGKPCLFTLQFPFHSMQAASCNPIVACGKNEIKLIKNPVCEQGLVFSVHEGRCKSLLPQ